MLKAYRDNGMPNPPPAWTLIQGQNYHFEVEEILDHEPKHIKPQAGLPHDILRRLQFKIRWRFYGPEFDTWEPYVCIKSAPESLAAYGFGPLWPVI